MGYESPFAHDSYGTRYKSEYWKRRALQEATRTSINNNIVPSMEMPISSPPKYFHPKYLFLGIALIVLLVILVFFVEDILKSDEFSESWKSHREQWLLKRIYFSCFETYKAQNGTGNIRVRRPRTPSAPRAPRDQVAVQLLPLSNTSTLLIDPPRYSTLYLSVKNQEPPPTYIECVKKMCS